MCENLTAQARTATPRNDVNVLLVPMDHALLCVSVDSLRLHRYAHFWHGGAHKLNHASRRLASRKQYQQAQTTDDTCLTSDAQRGQSLAGCNEPMQADIIEKVVEMEDQSIPSLSDAIRSRL